MQVKAYFPVKIDTIDGPIIIGVKRLKCGAANELRAKWNALEAQREKGDNPNAVVESSKFIEESIRQCVRIESIENGDSIKFLNERGEKVELKTGEDFLDFWGGNNDCAVRAFLAILWQSNLEPREKKVSSPPIASSPSSSEPRKDPAGPGLETAAPPAESSSSASNGGASNHPKDPSGSTEQEKAADPPSSSILAPSLN